MLKFSGNSFLITQPKRIFFEILLEHRTDGTDAFDTLYIGCEKFPQHDFYPINASGVM